MPNGNSMPRYARQQEEGMENLKLPQDWPWSAAKLVGKHINTRGRYLAQPRIWPQQRLKRKYDSPANPGLAAICHIAIDSRKCRSSNVAIILEGSQFKCPEGTPPSTHRGQSMRGPHCIDRVLQSLVQGLGFKTSLRYRVAVFTYGSFCYFGNSNCRPDFAFSFDFDVISSVFI